MSIKAVLFDLDGTLLPMEQGVFVKAYFGLLAKHLAPRGYEAERLYEVLWSGVTAMVKNDGSRTNEDAFYEEFVRAYGENAIKDKPYIDEFYENDFNQVQEVCGYSPKAKEIVELVKAMGKQAILATNPMFPQPATGNRMRWAGFQPVDFATYTTYEDCHYCKPNPKYYEELLEKLGLRAQECIMVGNDVEEDMIPASGMGMQVFLLTDCIINKKDRDISAYPQGDFEALAGYLRRMLG